MYKAAKRNNPNCKMNQKYLRQIWMIQKIQKDLSLTDEYQCDWFCNSLVPETVIYLLSDVFLFLVQKVFPLVRQ